MGATASARASFKYSVVASCTSDGSAINSGQCDVLRRRYTDTVGIASYAALDVLSSLAGVCALVMLLFVASFAYVCHFFRLSYTAANAVPDPEKHNGAAGGIPTAGAPAYPMNLGTEMTTQTPAPQQGVPYGSQPQSQYQYQVQQQQQQQQQQSPATHQNPNLGHAQPTQSAQGAVYSPYQTPNPYTQQQNIHTPVQGVGQQQFAYGQGLSQ